MNKRGLNRILFAISEVVCDFKMLFLEFIVSFIPFFVFGDSWRRSYENTKLLCNLCLHFARQDGQDGKKQETKVTKIPKTKRQKCGMNETYLYQLKWHIKKTAMFLHILDASGFSYTIFFWYVIFYCVYLLQTHNPDFLCLQEAKRRQSGDLAKELNYDHHESWMTCSILSRIPYKQVTTEYRSVFIITFQTSK